MGEVIFGAAVVGILCAVGAGIAWVVLVRIPRAWRASQREVLRRLDAIAAAESAALGAMEDTLKTVEANVMTTLVHTGTIYTRLGCGVEEGKKARSSEEADRLWAARQAQISTQKTLDERGYDVEDQEP